MSCPNAFLSPQRAVLTNSLSVSTRILSITSGICCPFRLDCWLNSVGEGRAVSGPVPRVCELASYQEFVTLADRGVPLGLVPEGTWSYTRWTLGYYYYPSMHPIKSSSQQPI